MKRILTFIVAAVVPLALSAQDWQDARYFTENNYLGTARTLGMGNAVTAIGGDPGAVGFNPAGSAVAGYSQIVISPGFTLSTTRAAGVFSPGLASGTGTGDVVNTQYGRFALPNFGVIFTLNNGRRSGWKRSSFGLMVNSTNNYTDRIVGAGVNDDNSYAASLATSAEGYTESVLGSESWWYDGSDLSHMPKWIDMAGYRSGMFNGIPGGGNRYQAVTEVRDAAGNCWLAAPLCQKYGQQTTGSKYDILFNWAANYNDIFYVGVNVGVTTVLYGMTEYFQEMPENPDDFPDIVYTDGTVARFNSLQMKHNYSLRGAGAYVKVGVLWRPVGGLRLAAAFQSPTLMSFTARQAYAGEVLLTGKSINPSTTPEDSWSYGMTQPLRLNAGVAYSFGQVAVLSADYEMVNYGSIRYRGVGSGSTPGYLEDANLDIKDALGFAHQLRVGAEVKPIPALSIRAGYNLTSYGQKNWLEADWSLTPLTPQEKWSLVKHSASLGVGYSFGSFFLDAAARVRFSPTEYIVPYQYYTYQTFTDKYPDTSIITPEIAFQSRFVDIILTAGWRF